MLKTTTTTRPRTLDELLDPRLVSRLTQLDVSSRKVFAGKLKGERRSKKRGESVEFADHRPYVVGDDLRHIDWNIFGRLDRLFIKLFLEEEDLSLHIVLDASASMDCGEPSKFLYAQRLTAALAYIGLVNLNRVTLTALGAAAGGAGGDGGSEGDGGPPRPAPVSESVIRNLRGRRRVHDMGRWLCSLTPGAGADFTEAAKRIALTRTGKGVMIVISDFFLKEGYEQGLRYLLGRGYDVFAIQTLSPQEIEPSLGGDLRLKDIEDGDLAEVTISSALLKRYKANLSAYCDELRAFCARREITHITVQTDTPVDTLVFEYLRSRGLLR
ncbi:MAG: DUF58 domain-containing protein [Phycisphaeraceae bacterium]|nr:MAG: DUF58 domain-containing protein [Phycisphaeraceae bacterium]